MQTLFHNYTTEPELPRCIGSFDARELRFSRTMIFAIKEINNSTELLPGIRLGYQIYDTCGAVPVAVHVAFQLLNGQDPLFYKDSNCSQSGMVMAAVGDSGSTPTISISRLMGSFNIPLVSHFATCACLSDKKEYPTFFRTIPSDDFQADALAKLVKYFGWTWIGAVHSDSDYGNNGMASFLKTANREGICVEYIESFYRTDTPSKIKKVADVIRRSSAVVVVAFAADGDMKFLLEELARDPPPPRQWIGSESWVTDQLSMSFSFCAGTIGVAIQQSVIPGLREFLLDLSPSEVAASSVLTEFWEEVFNCSLRKSRDTYLYRRECNGTEDIRTVESLYIDTSQLRISNMVYKAVYAIAHAIHNAACQNTNGLTKCNKNMNFDPKKIVAELKKVKFIQNGYNVSFEANGDPVAFYELVNWQKSDSGEIELVTVGYYDASLPVGQEFRIFRNLTWLDGGTQVPVSACSQSCPPGTRKVLQKGQPICCYDCTPCPEGEISNQTDSPDCFHCPKEFWPNAKKDVCIPKPVEFLSFNEVLSVILVAFSISGACLTTITGIIFFKHRTTPIVSHFATCACLSDKQQFPTFFRTIPSDHFQADALAKLVKYFGWTWIGVVHSDSDYGNNGMASFLEAAVREGICVEYIESFFRTDPQRKIQRVADVIRRSTAVVVLAFTAIGEMNVLLKELARDPPPPRQWIASEAWATDPNLMSFSFCAGTIGVAIQQSIIPGLREFLLDLALPEVAASSALTEFWEDAFNCSLSESADPDKRVCNGTEDIKSLKSPYTETSQLRITNMVYKATYAIAHAIHNAVCNKTNTMTQCEKHTKLGPKQVLEELKKINFSRNGYHVSFDANGDPIAFYELVNWQRGESGVIKLVTVGYYDASLPKGQEFHINKNLTWLDGGTQVPESVCSQSCPPGTHKVLQKGKPICCYDCIPCPEGEISNKTDSIDCFPCAKEFWPNMEKDECLPKPVEFLSFTEGLSIILAVCSVIGACMAIITAVIFLNHRTTPIVRANNSELSFLLLFSLTLCFLCSLTFIGAPSEWSCMLRHTAFGITFVLCISCVLGKTIVVLMAFKATLPGSNAMKWFGPPQHRITVVILTFIQVMICTLWLVLSPPFPVKNLTTHKEKIILECALGSAVGFWAVLGYIGILAVFCFVLAVLARKLPDNFNEAKLITFSMLIFCAVWITFVPAYVSSPGKLTVAVEIFAILASSFGLMLCIFAPKCFIILFQPEKNNKKYLMKKN
ncbi:vomeronasal type-2 receptor 1-like [Cyprinodon tularosa]|uniref:vomeronasal type-2 receptor 1-like n=1 Tax=Cyprinodon tularosa TaxID=77115 RepID=UPI0018E281B2|nr:vomeronasal type-2 receptor 1-like [Cyprinodon tularosa]